jgi:hypothetical protein
MKTTVIVYSYRHPNPKKTARAMVDKFTDFADKMLRCGYG